MEYKKLLSFMLLAAMSALSLHCTALDKTTISAESLFKKYSSPEATLVRETIEALSKIDYKAEEAINRAILDMLNQAHCKGMDKSCVLNMLRKKISERIAMLESVKFDLDTAIETVWPSLKRTIISAAVCVGAFLGCRYIVSNFNFSEDLDNCLNDIIGPNIEAYQSLELTAVERIRSSDATQALNVLKAFGQYKHLWATCDYKFYGALALACGCFVSGLLAIGGGCVDLPKDISKLWVAKENKCETLYIAQQKIENILETGNYWRLYEDFSTLVKASA